MGVGVVDCCGHGGGLAPLATCEAVVVWSIGDSTQGKTWGGSLITIGVGTPINAPSSIITLFASPIRFASSTMVADPLAVADTFLKSFAMGTLTLARMVVGTRGETKATTVATYAKKRFRNMSIGV